MAFFSKKSTKVSTIQSSWSPVWTVCLSLRFMLMKPYSVAVTHQHQICPLCTLYNHHLAEGPSHTCDLPRLDSLTWGVRKRVFLELSGCLCGVSLLSAPLSGAGIYRDDYQSRFHWCVCVCVWESRSEECGEEEERMRCLDCKYIYLPGQNRLPCCEWLQGRYYVVSYWSKWKVSHPLLQWASVGFDVEIY